MIAKLIAIQADGQNICLTVEFRGKKSDPNPVTTRAFTFTADATAWQIRDTVAASLAGIDVAVRRANALKSLEGTEITI